MTPNIGISAANLKKSSAILATILSNEMTLYVKTRKFHWNISGNSFMELHKLFEDQYRIFKQILMKLPKESASLAKKLLAQ